MKPFLAPTKCSTSITGLLVAMAPRVANVTESMVAAITRIRMRDAGGDRGSRHGAHAVDPAAMIVERGARHLFGQHPPQLRDVGRGARRDLDHDQARHRQLVERQTVAEPGLEQLGGFLFRIGAHIADAGKGARDRRRLVDRRHRDRGRAPG